MDREPFSADGGTHVFRPTSWRSFGCVRGVLISMALLTAWSAFGEHATAGAESSAVVLSASRLFVAIAPMDLKQSFHRYYSQARSLWQSSEKRRKDSDL